MPIRLDELDAQLQRAYSMHFIEQIERYPNHITIHFSHKVPHKKIHEVIEYINTSYKDVAWIPRSLFNLTSKKTVKIFFKQDQA